LNQQAVHPAIVAKRTYDIVRVSDQSITAYQMQIVKFLLHALVFLGYTKPPIVISRKELSYHLHITMLLFIQVHFIAPAHAKDTKFGATIIQSYLWQNIIL